MTQQLIQAAPEVIQKGLVDIETQLRVERFLTLEAALMDGHEYDRWMKLWHGDDVLYWVPCNSDDQDPSTGIAIIYDDRSRLLERMMRLKDKTAHAYRPLAKLVRSLSGIVPTSVSGDELEVVSSFVLGETRVGVQNIWMGRVIHWLVDTDEGYRIRSKKVLLLNNDDAMPNLTFLV